MSIPQNGQTHSCLSVFDHIVGLPFKGLTKNNGQKIVYMVCKQQNK